jgi:2-keto-3-deoxy-L-rhamnonate aldolase RhmA
MELRPNRVKRKLQQGEQAFVAAGFTHADDIDAFGPAGFDAVWIEGEHGAMTFDELGNLSRACDLWGMTSIVRVNRNDQNLIYRTLDRGAQGIVVPHVNTRAEAENVVAGGRFAPLGQRGMFTSRQGYGVEGYFENANNEVLLTILIEDIVAVENLDEILEVDQIDVFFVAPSDLGASMGYIHDLQNPKVQDTIDGALEKIIKAGRAAGTMTTPDSVGKFAGAGVQMLLVGIGGWLQEGAKTFMKRANEAL